MPEVPPAGPATWFPAYVAIGSNLDDPESRVKAALRALAGLPGTRVEAVSGLLRNPAVGPGPQPDFVNAVAGLLTRLPPAELLAALLAIERQQGRDRSSGVRWGPRHIDLDLLVHGTTVLDTADLVLPHPRMASRNFVLFPLLEIAPGLDVPGHGPVARLAANLRLHEQEEPQQAGTPWAIPATSPSKAP